MTDQTETKVPKEKKVKKAAAKAPAKKRVDCRTSITQT